MTAPVIRPMSDGRVVLVLDQVTAADVEHALVVCELTMADDGLDFRGSAAVVRRDLGTLMGRRRGSGFGHASDIVGCDTPVVSADALRVALDAGPSGVMEIREAAAVLDRSERQVRRARRLPADRGRIQVVDVVAAAARRQGSP